MKYMKYTAIVIASMIAFTAVAACSHKINTPIDAVEISKAEEEIISSMQAEGKNEIEIAQALMEYEDQIKAAYSSETTTGANGETEAPTETTVWEREINGTVVRITPTPVLEGTTGTNGTTNGTTGTTSGTTVTNPTNGNPTGWTNPTTTTVPGGTTIPTNPTQPTSGTTTTTETTAKPTETQITIEYKTSMEDECIRLINEIRKQEAYDLGSTFYVPIVATSSLRTQAHNRCRELIDDFSHNSAGGYKLSSECIHRTNRATASSIVNAWKNSAGHYKSIIQGCITGDGDVASKNGIVGIAYYNGYYYCVFGLGGNNSGSAPSSGYTPPTTPPTEATTKPTEATTQPAEATTKPTVTTASPSETTATPTPKPTATPTPKPTATPTPKPTSTPTPTPSGVIDMSNAEKADPNEQFYVLVGIDVEIWFEIDPDDDGVYEWTSEILHFETSEYKNPKSQDCVAKLEDMGYTVVGVGNIQIVKSYSEPA